MTQHTPGPWVLNGYQVERTDGISRTIATVAPRRRIGTDYAANSADEAMANAALIAAAPDLLIMCENLLKFVCGFNSNNCVVADDDIIVRAKSLIIKVKGKVS